MTPLYIFLGIGLLGIGAIIFLLLKQKGGNVTAGDTLKLEQEIAKRTEENGELKSLLAAVKDEKSELAGKNKLLFAENVKISAKLESIEREREQLQSKITHFEATQERREKEIDNNIRDLKESRTALENEKQRVIAEEQEARQQEEEERDRLWAEHENSVIAMMTSLCKLPQLAFQHYTNTSLPDGFDGSLKPDFMIEFIDQYIIFDAKASKADSLQTYINNTVKKTIEKVKKNPKIANTLYLVVPSMTIGELKTFYYPIDGYNIYVISPEAIGPILASLKKITAYEFAEQMDPQHRENIVQLIADLDFHVSLRNGVDLMLTKMGANLLGKAEQIDPKLAEEVRLKKQEKKLPNLATSDLKKLISDVTLQNIEIQRLVSPKAAVSELDTLL